MAVAREEPADGAIAEAAVAIEDDQQAVTDLGARAALGGLAAGRDARLLAADVRLHRARLVRAATAGTGRARVVVADGTASAWRQGAFDRVLADVPCSGLGALRRRPEARWRRTPADVAELGALQRGLLAAALDSARPGGVVAYVTCSPHLAETRGVVAAVLAARDDTEVLDAPAMLPEVPGCRRPVRPVLAAPARHRRDLPRAAPADCPAAIRATRVRRPVPVRIGRRQCRRVPCGMAGHPRRRGRGALPRDGDSPRAAARSLADISRHIQVRSLPL